MGRILAIFLLIVAGIALYAWLAGGAGARIARLAPAFNNPLHGFFEAQEGKNVAYTAESLAPGVPTIGSYEGGETISSTHSSDVDAAAIERAKEFGQPSPSRGTISIATYGAAGSAVQSEYITLTANPLNAKPISITGWSLQSAVSGNGARIGDGVAEYRMGSVGSEQAITLKPGEQAIINSSISPVGSSFHTNECTGYLAQFQPFTPALSTFCPSPASEMPNTLDDQRQYGASCIDFAATLPSCAYYLNQFPDGISNSCRSFVTNVLTYNGCVDRHRFEAGFTGNTWRIYLSAANALWDHAHDVIRLLDAQGRTVDVLSY